MKNNSEKYPISPGRNGDLPSRSSPLRTTCELMHISFSSNWCSVLSCLTMKHPYLSSGPLIRARSVKTTSSSSDTAGCGVSSFCKDLTPSSFSTFAWGLTVTCKEGRMLYHLDHHHHHLPCPNHLLDPWEHELSFQHFATHTYPSSFVDVWNSPAFKSRALVLALAGWWNASCSVMSNPNVFNLSPSLFPRSSYFFLQKSPHILSFSMMRLSRCFW